MRAHFWGEFSLLQNVALGIFSIFPGVQYNSLHHRPGILDPGLRPPHPHRGRNLLHKQPQVLPNSPAGQ